ncbi:MAG TPA: AAA family ATPase [Puia sp.]|nr:AAA family ATPase [Puia sp.]
MKIKKLQIKNFKSLVDFELEDLKPFCAFVGPNASGKSNIFEALEFTNYVIRYTHEAPRFFGGLSYIYSYNARPILDHNDISIKDSLFFNYNFDTNINIGFHASFLGVEESQNLFGSLTAVGSSPVNGANRLPSFDIRNLQKRKTFVSRWKEAGNPYDNEYEQFVDNFVRIFIGKSDLNRTPAINTKLSPDASNLPQVIGMIFENEEKRKDFIEWLRILIPEFNKIEIRRSNIDGKYEFFIYEKGTEKPFPRGLISDGTYNILALLSFVYQSDQPQFLCIEEPENGLHPQAIELLVDFFREQCEEKGHHIWLNTHSQTLVRHLEIEEVILVNKVNGATKAKQLTKQYDVDIRTDEAWLTNALGGGVL